MVGTASARSRNSGDRLGGVLAGTFRDLRQGCTASAAGTAFSGNFEIYPGTLPKISGLP